MIIIDQACVSLYQKERVVPPVITFFLVPSWAEANLTGFSPLGNQGRKKTVHQIRSSGPN